MTRGKGNSMVTFRNYTDNDYEAVCRFFKKLNQNKQYINWNWARFEWMYYHEEFDRDSIEAMELWLDEDKVIGAAVYDMYFGEGFCGVLTEYEELYPDILEYAYTHLKDDSGLGIAINDEDISKIKLVKKAGFSKSDQEENIMSISLHKKLQYTLPDNMKIISFNPAESEYDYEWLLWQGFDHGNDKEEFKHDNNVITQSRPHLNEDLCIGIINEYGELIAHCCCWYGERTDYAYIEPVCVIPEYRGMGLAKAAVYEALNRCRSLGAEDAYVISDMEFYSKLGFVNDKHYTFYWKE